MAFYNRSIFGNLGQKRYFKYLWISKAINNFVLPVLMFYLSLNLQISAQYLTQVLHMRIKIPQKAETNNLLKTELFLSFCRIARWLTFTVNLGQS